MEGKGEGGSGGVDVPDDETGVSTGFVKARSEVIGVFGAEGEGVAGARVADVEGDALTAGESVGP